MRLFFFGELLHQLLHPGEKPYQGNECSRGGGALRQYGTVCVLSETYGSKKLDHHPLWLVPQGTNCF